MHTVYTLKRFTEVMAAADNHNPNINIFSWRFSFLLKAIRTAVFPILDAHRCSFGLPVSLAIRSGGSWLAIEVKGDHLYDLGGWK